MTPAPSLERQRMLDALIEFLRPRLRESGRGALFSGINVFREIPGYRIPALTFVAAGREPCDGAIWGHGDQRHRRNPTLAHR